MDWNALGAAVVALLVGAGGAVTWWAARGVREARLSAEAAKSGAERSVADAETAVYRLLVERMAALEKEVARLTEAENQSRLRERALEEHIFHLENLMRRAGMDVPERVRRLG